MGNRKYKSAMFLNEKISLDNLWGFLEENYTKEERDLLLKFLLKYSKDLIFMSRPEWGLSGKSEVKDLKEFISKMGYFSSIYYLVWSSVSMLTTRSDKSSSLYKAILAWKLKVDCDKETLRRIRKNRIKRTLSALEEAKKRKAISENIRKVYSREDISDLLDYMNSNSIYVHTCEEEVTSAISLIYEGVKVSSSTLNTIKWATRWDILKDVALTLVKPIEDMPIYINSTLCRGAVAKWRIKNGK